MKKNFVILASCLLAIFATTFVTSCDKAHSTSKGYTQGIFTVDRNFLRPENSDTFYTVKKDEVASFGLKDGDRAIITLGYDIDNTIGAIGARWFIKSVEEKIPAYALSADADVDKEAFSSAIAGVGPMPLYGSHWMWKGLQNIYVGYYSNGSFGNFKMTPAGMSGDTICFNLYSQIPAGDEPVKQLLTFDIKSVASMLSEDDAARLNKLDSVYTKITTQVEFFNNTGSTIKKASISGGKYKRTF